MPFDITKRKELKKYSKDKIKKHLKKGNKSYVLITCSYPNEKGKMQVEMDYSGDEDLASYLIESAQNIFQGQVNQAKDSC
ncbi:MAG: hypothetical protein JXA94_06150 [Parachlamydiales bacterium]|nr:hypothetical protein [Parachlamydiales bacterium]